MLSSRLHHSPAPLCAEIDVELGPKVMKRRFVLVQVEFVNDLAVGSPLPSWSTLTATRSRPWISAQVRVASFAA